MSLYIYYILLGIYSLVLVASLFYYLSRRAPGGDASVGWAWGILYSAGLAVILVIALFFRNHPTIGLIVLSFPLVFLALPKIRRARTEWYVRFPSFTDTPPLTLFIENYTNAALRIKVDCWFPTSNKDGAVLFDSFDYYLESREQKNYLLSAYQTRLLAHKSKYVSVQIYERVTEEYEGHTYMREIQPCMQYFDENIEAFRTGKYTVAINPK